MKKPFRNHPLIILSCALPFLAACSSTPPVYRTPLPASTATAKEIREAERLVGRSMIDPDSVEFQDVAGYRHGTLTTLCGEVNAKNRFGGYVGFRHFTAVGGVVVMNQLEGKGDFWENDFNNNWNASCQ